MTTRYGAAGRMAAAFIHSKLTPLVILASVALFADVVGSRYVHLAILVLVWLAGVGMWDDWLKLTKNRRSGTRDGLRLWETHGGGAPWTTQCSPATT